MEATESRITDQESPNSMAAVYGHHYFNPQWVMYDCQTPALLYNNAVYFTVSFDGTHYFHQHFQGQFCAPPNATMVVSEPDVVQEKIIDRYEYDKENRTSNHHSNYSMWDQPQVLLNPYLNPWQRSTKSKKRHKHYNKSKNESRPKKDVRSTMVPLFPEVFNLGHE